MASLYPHPARREATLRRVPNDAGGAKNRREAAHMTVPNLSEVARLVGEPSRARILDALLDGRAWTGRELARVAHVTPSTASEHLGRLVQGALLTVVPQGRHRYYRLASADVAQALEALMFLAPQPAAEPSGRSAIDPELRRARTCYDHLAGELGIAREAIVLGPTSAALTSAGADLFATLAIKVDTGNPRRLLCRPCLDWSERRFHLAGRAGAALARHAFAAGWVRHGRAARAVAVTERGVAALRAAFDIEWRP
jgi:DNA-binding transcriptional ArsR family regulator